MSFPSNLPFREASERPFVGYRERPALLRIYRCCMRIALYLVFAACGISHASPSCPRDPAAIVVDTREHRMTLCEVGVAVRDLPVAIGSGGVDKQREGDRKTPLGSYSLASPQLSDKFHKFLLIGYPTADQRARGKTGGDVGLHGPSRKHDWLGRLRNWLDWTDGCIAVATDEAIDQVARWVTEKHARRIVIE